jgi:hypothetical protein
LICPNDSTAIFSIPKISNALSYNWILPAGTSIIGKTDSNAIRIRFGGQGGTITVKGINACGSGSTGTLNVNTKIVLPANVTAVASNSNPCLGSTVLFTATPTNGGITPVYQWLKNNQPIAGANQSTYSTNTILAGDRVKVILISSLNCGLPNTDTSAQITMSAITPRTPSVTIESNAQNDTSCTGEPVTFNSNINAGGGSVPLYAWFRNTTAIQGQTANSLILSTLTSADSIRMRLTVSGGCLTTNQVFSKAIRLKIITLSPNAGTDTSLCPNTTVNFSGTPSGGTWSGAGINPSGTFNSGSSGVNSIAYQVQRYGCTRTDTRNVTVFSIPPVTYSVSGNTLNANATGAVSWKWYLNNQPIPDENSSSLTIQESGNYCVEAGFATGCFRKSDCQPQIFTASKDRLLPFGSLHLNPNPGSSMVRISWTGQLSKILLVNMLGQEIRNIEINNNQTQIELMVQSLAPGPYKLVGTLENGQRILRTLVKQ